MKMKTLFALIMVAVLAILTVPKASAQSPIYAAQTISVPNVTAGAVSNNLGLVVPCGKQGNTAVSLTTSGCTNLVLYLGTSVDGSNYTTNTYSLTTGGGGATVISNYATVGIGYLRIDRAVNTGTINATNTASYGVKINAP